MDNFDIIIKSDLIQSSVDTFYLVTLKNNSATYYININGEEDLLNKMPTIKNICNSKDMIAYIHPSARNYRDVIFNCIKGYLNRITVNYYKEISDDFNIKSLEPPFNSKIVAFIPFDYNIEDFKKLFLEPYYIINTSIGDYVILPFNFNIKKFQQNLIINNLPYIDVQPDLPILLYDIPNK